MKKLLSVTGAVLVGLLSAACGDTPGAAGSNPLSATAPTPLSSSARASLQGFEAFPGTGTNPGAGDPNSCPSVAPVITDIGSNLDFIKALTTKVGELPQVRGYQWHLERKDADTTPFSAFFDTSADNAQEGRELHLDPADFDPGQYLLKVRARLWGCPTEHGTWSAAREFHVAGDVDSSRRKKKAPHWPTWPHWPHFPKGTV